MAEAEAAGDLGPWAGANLQATAKVDVGIGADDGVPPNIRFKSNVAKLVRRRLAIAKSKPDTEHPAVFLLQPSPPDSATCLNPVRVPMLDNGLTELTGLIWFVGANPASGHFAPHGAADDDALFRLITDDLDQANTPAIIFDPRLPDKAVRYYPEGLNEPSVYELIHLSTQTVAFDEVVAAVESTYKEKMITPDAQPKAGQLWKNAAKWWPHKNAEDLIQMYLEIGLNTAFPTCTIRPEQTMPEGRLDIEIIENDALDRSIIKQHGILELKVLRSFGVNGSTYSDGDTRKWVKSGVEQAASYRDSKGATWGALMCFDMRNADDGERKCFSHVKTLSGTLKVHLKRWYLYATSKHLRAAQTAAKS